MLYLYDYGEKRSVELIPATKGEIFLDYNENYVFTQTLERQYYLYSTDEAYLLDFSLTFCPCSA